jgi:hypothetical protein
MTKEPNNPSAMARATYSDLDVINSKLDRIANDIREVKEGVLRQNSRIIKLEIEMARQQERANANTWVTRGISLLLAAVAGYIGYQN